VSQAANDAIMPLAPLHETARLDRAPPGAPQARLFVRLESRARAVAMAVIAVAWLLPFLVSAGVVLSFMALAISHGPDLLAAAEPSALHRP
jgi:hypothetical protein